MQLDKILELADAGLYLFPTDAETKHPLTAHGFKDATNDREELKKLFANAAGTVGVAVNLRKSGLVCLDIDVGHKTEIVKDAGIQELKHLTSLHRGFNLNTASYVEKTKNGGFHAFYRIDNDDARKINITDHIELLTDAVTIAPTPGYRKIKGTNSFKDISVVPGWMLHKTEKSTFKAPTRTVMYGRCKTIGEALNSLYKPVPEGERHNRLVTFTCSFFATGADADVIQQLVYRAGETMGLEPDEIEQIWQWALKTAINQLDEIKA